MDEFISYQVTDPARSAAELYRGFWSHDQHPPSYYALLWLWRRTFSIGHSLIGLRSLSLALSLVVALALTRAYRILLGSSLVFAVVLASSPTWLYYSQESRSYFLSFLGGCSIGIFFISSLEGAPGPRSRGWSLTAGLFGAALCTVHLVSLLICGGVLAVLCVAAMRSGRRTAAISAAAIGLCILSPVLAWMLLGPTGARGALSGFWITRRQLVHAVVWLPAFLGLPTLVGIGTGILSPPSGSVAAVQRAHSLRWAGIAAAVVTATALGASVIKPFVVLRYFAALSGFLVPVAAVALAPLAARLRPAGFALVALAALGAGWAAVALTPDQAGEWRRPGVFVQRLPECRGATIPVAILTAVPAGADMASWRAMFAWYAGAEERFVPADDSAIIAARAQACPVRLWAADLQERYLGPAVRSAFAQVCRAEPNARVLMFKHGVIIAGRRVPAAWPGREETCSDLLRSTQAGR